MERIMEGKHTVFMIQITGKWVRHKADGMWYKTRAEEVREGAATQSEKKQHWTKTGYSVTVGGAAANIKVMCKGYRI